MKMIRFNQHLFSGFNALTQRVKRPAATHSALGLNSDWWQTINGLTHVLRTKIVWPESMTSHTGVRGLSTTEVKGSARRKNRRKT